MMYSSDHAFPICHFPSPAINDKFDNRSLRERMRGRTGMNGRGTRVCTGARGGGAAKPKQSMVHDMVDWFAWSGRASIVHTRCVSCVSGAGRTVESGHHQLSVSVWTVEWSVKEEKWRTKIWWLNQSKGKHGIDWLRRQPD